MNNHIVKRCFICNVILANNDVFYCDICDEATKVTVKSSIADMETRALALPLTSYLRGVLATAKYFKDNKLDISELVKQFAEAMHKRGKAYHWDDCATDIIGPPHGEPIFTQEEALLCNEVVAELHCELLFEESNRLLGNTED